jgi:hypothetical protein
MKSLTCGAKVSVGQKKEDELLGLLDYLQHLIHIHIYIQTSLYEYCSLQCKTVFMSKLCMNS